MYLGIIERSRKNYAFNFKDFCLLVVVVVVFFCEVNNEPGHILSNSVKLDLKRCFQSRLFGVVTLWVDL